MGNKKSIKLKENLLIVFYIIIQFCDFIRPQTSLSLYQMINFKKLSVLCYHNNSWSSYLSFNSHENLTIASRGEISSSIVILY